MKRIATTELTAKRTIPATPAQIDDVWLEAKSGRVCECAHERDLVRRSRFGREDEHAQPRSVVQGADD